MQHVTLQMLACDKLKAFSRQNYLKKPLATQISRSNAYRLLSLGPNEGQSVQKYTPHNRKTQRRYTPRDSSRQRRHFGKSIPEFGETHSSVLGYERRPVSASIMSRSCFASFPVCVYKFSSHYLNNITFIDNSLEPLATESPCIMELIMQSNGVQCTQRVHNHSAQQWLRTVRKTYG